MHDPLIVLETRECINSETYQTFNVPCCQGILDKLISSVKSREILPWQRGIYLWPLIIVLYINLPISLMLFVGSGSSVVLSVVEITTEVRVLIVPSLKQAAFVQQQNNTVNLLDSISVSLSNFATFVLRLLELR